MRNMHKYYTTLASQFGVVFDKTKLTDLSYIDTELQNKDSVDLRSQFGLSNTSLTKEIQNDEFLDYVVARKSYFMLKEYAQQNISSKWSELFNNLVPENDLNANLSQVSNVLSEKFRFLESNNLEPTIDCTTDIFYIGENFLYDKNPQNFVIKLLGEFLGTEWAESYLRDYSGKDLDKTIKYCYYLGLTINQLFGYDIDVDLFNNFKLTCSLYNVEKKSAKVNSLIVDSIKDIEVDS